MSQSRTVFVTGASSGIGRLTVGRFLAAGWTVFAGVRALQSRPALFAPHEKLVLVELDITLAADRRNAAQIIFTFGSGQLDCLVNNAGFGVFGSIEDLTEHELRDQFEVNFFGLTLFTKECLPLLRAAQGRVIQVSSILGLMGVPLSGAYCSSKFALEGLSESLRYELAPFGVQVSLIEPGGFKTEFGTNSKWGANVFGTGSVYEKISSNYLRLRQTTVAKRGGDPTQVADRIVGLASCKKMPPRIQVGSDSWWVARILKVLPDGLISRVLSMIYRRRFLVL